MKGNRQGSLSRSIIRRSDQNRKIKYCFYFAILLQLVKKVRTDFFDKLKKRLRAVGSKSFFIPSRAASLVLPLLPRLLRFPQVLQQLAAGTVGEQEAVLLAPLLLPLADMRLEVLHLDDHLVLVGEFTNTGH